MGNEHRSVLRQPEPRHGDAADGLGGVDLRWSSCMKPYATSKGIVIGSAWTPRPPSMSRDAVAVQVALLSKGAQMKPFANYHKAVLRDVDTVPACTGNCKQNSANCKTRDACQLPVSDTSLAWALDDMPGWAMPVVCSVCAVALLGSVAWALMG